MGWTTFTFLFFSLPYPSVNLCIIYVCLYFWVCLSLYYVLVSTSRNKGKMRSPGFTGSIVWHWIANGKFYPLSLSLSLQLQSIRMYFSLVEKKTPQHCTPVVSLFFFISFPWIYLYNLHLSLVCLCVYYICMEKAASNYPCSLLCTWNYCW